MDFKNVKYLEQFKKQKNDIEFYTTVLCQKRSEITKALKWIETQKIIPYLPKDDIFAYYCPICNNVIKLKENCNSCGQNINWEFHSDMKLINSI